jgi:hypothetical protein
MKKYADEHYNEALKKMRTTVAQAVTSFGGPVV